VRVLGLDVGSKTIGIAVTDELGVAAHAVTTLARKGTAKDVAAVLDIARARGAEQLVVGLPYDPDGSEGQRARRVRVFIDALTAAGARVETWDESFSTVAAEATLLRANLSRQKRKKVIDRVAAQVILQEWLDAR
jgi:putative pre-16S rRNA nuclease